MVLQDPTKVMQVFVGTFTQPPEMPNARLVRRSKAVQEGRERAGERRAAEAKPAKAACSPSPPLRVARQRPPPNLRWTTNRRPTEGRTDGGGGLCERPTTAFLPSLLPSVK